MEDLKLGESEYRFMTIIWDAEPLSSRQLVELALEQLGWKKSTTYTVLKKLTERGFARNEDSLVTSLIPREAVHTPSDTRAADGEQSGKAVGVGLTPQVGTRAAVGKPRQIDALFIHGKGGDEMIQKQIQGFNVGAPVLPLGELGTDEDEGVLSPLACVHGVAVNGYAVQFGGAVATLACAVEEDHQRIASVGIVILGQGLQIAPEHPRPGDDIRLVGVHTFTSDSLFCYRAPRGG